MVGFAFTQWLTLVNLHPSFDFLALAQNRAESFFSLGRYCGIFRDGTFLKMLGEFAERRSMPLISFVFSLGLPMFFIYYLLSALFYVSFKAVLSTTIYKFMHFYTLKGLWTYWLKLTIFKPWAFVFLNCAPFIVVLFILEWLYRIWRGLSVSHVTDSKLFRLIFFPYKYYNDYSSHTVFSLILRRVRNFILFQVYFIFFNPFYFLTHILMAFGYLSKMLLSQALVWVFTQVVLVFWAVYVSIVVNPVYFFAESAFRIFLTPIYLWNFVSELSFRSAWVIYYLINTVVAYLTLSIRIEDVTYLKVFDSNWRPILGKKTLFECVEGSMFSWAFKDNFLEKFDYPKLSFVFSNLNSLNIFSLQYIMTVDFFIFLLFSLSAYFTLTTPTFRKKIFFFFCFIVVSTMWGFYASFDGFILFFLSTELLIIVLLLMLSMSGKYNSLSKSTKIISLNVYIILSLVVYYFSVKYFGFHSIYRVPNWYAGYNDIITGDLFAIFYFFFVRYQFTVIATTLILSLFTIFFILVFSHFRYMQQKSEVKNTGIIISRRQNIYNQYWLKSGIRLVRRKFLSKFHKYKKFNKSERVDLENEKYKKSKIVKSAQAKFVHEDYLKNRKLKKRI